MSERPNVIFEDASKKLILEDLQPKLVFADESKKLVFQDLQPKLVFADTSKKLVFDIIQVSELVLGYPYTYPMQLS